VVVSKIAQAKRSEPTQVMGPVFVFIEMMCALLTVSDVNNRLCDGRNKRDHFTHFNDTYEYYVQVTWDSKQWVDQLSVGEDKTTPVKSIQDRCCVIKTDTDHTTISTVVEKIIRLTHNVFLTKLRKFLDSNGHIRSGQQKEDVREAIRLFYFVYVKMPRHFPVADRTSSPSPSSPAPLPDVLDEVATIPHTPVSRPRPCMEEVDADGSQSKSH
jgi:hypothetical protein